MQLDGKCLYRLQWIPATYYTSQDISLVYCAFTLFYIHSPIDPFTAITLFVGVAAEIIHKEAFPLQLLFTFKRLLCFHVKLDPKSRLTCTFWALAQLGELGYGTVQCITNTTLPLSNHLTMVEKGLFWANANSNIQSQMIKTYLEYILEPADCIRPVCHPYPSHMKSTVKT